MKRNLFLAVAMLWLSSTMMAQSTVRKFEWKNSTDGQSVVYAYLPDASKATGRAIVDCPGGGYSHLAMDHEGHQWAEYFNSQGIAYFVLKYRMPNGDRTIPLGDAYHAIQTVRDSASVWHVNPYDVGIMGFSAGGHLASSVSTHADWKVRPNFTILFYPVVSMNERDTHKGSVNGLKKKKKADKELVKSFSNFNSVKRHLTPPAIILLANDDRVVPPVTNGVAYYSAMRRAGNNCSLYIYPSGGHGFGFRTNYAYHDQMLTELTNWLNALPSPKADAVRVACIGNSITDGFGIDMADNLGYPAVLQKKLGSNYNVKNFGVSGRTLLNKGDLPYQKEEAWHDALAFEPNIAIVKLGTNDVKGYNWAHKNEFHADYQQLIDSLKALPTNPRIILVTPIGTNVKWDMKEETFQEIIPMIRKIAKKNKLEVIEMRDLFKNEDGKQFQADGVHPSIQGATQMATIISQTLLKDASSAKNSKKKKK